MRFDVISIFPQMFDALTQWGISGRAFQKQDYQLFVHNPRDFTTDNYRTVDDRPYGGGPGMVMLAEPLQKAILSVREKQCADGLLAAPVVYLSPQGQALTQQKVLALARLPALTLLCGRYEAIDQRIIHHYVDEELSIGDFVLSGGELPAMALIDAILRQLPGVLHNPDSTLCDSFSEGLLDHPHYTRPEYFMNERVPEILLSGHHVQIQKWRREQALRASFYKRPDLLIKAHENAQLTTQDEVFLKTLVTPKDATKS